MKNDLTNKSTFKMSSAGELVLVKSIPDLKKIIKECKEKKRRYEMIGWGANMVLAENIDFVLIKLDFTFKESYLDKIRETYDLPASLPLSKLTSHAIKFGLKGFDALTGIPASLGGAIYMNAGTSLGEIGDLVKEVTILRSSGELEKYQITKGSFSYRKNNFLKDGDIIVAAKLFHHGIDASVPDKIKDYMNYRRSTQPLAAKTCGCVFKNHSVYRAGKGIDALGLKGLIVNGIKVSHKHANFFENIGKASLKDFKSIVNTIQIEAELNFGQKFDLEVEILEN